MYLLLSGVNFVMQRKGRYTVWQTFEEQTLQYPAEKLCSFLKSLSLYIDFFQGIPQVLEIKGDPQGLGVSIITNPGAIGLNIFTNPEGLGVNIFIFHISRRSKDKHIYISRRPRSKHSHISRRPRGKHIHISVKPVGGGGDELTYVKRKNYTVQCTVCRQG